MRPKVLFRGFVFSWISSDYRVHTEPTHFAPWPQNSIKVHQAVGGGDLQARVRPPAAGTSNKGGTRNGGR